MIPPIGPNFGAIYRYAPSGPLVELLASIIGNTSMVPGNTVEDALNNLLGATGTSAWDVIVEDLSDLPAPVAGFIDLPDGSYAFKNPINVGADVLRVPAGGSVLLKGMGGFSEKVITGAGAQVLRVEGSARLETLNLAATAGDALSIDGAVEAMLCQYSAVGADRAVFLETGLYRDSLSRITGGDLGGLVIADGEANLSQCRMLGGLLHALEVQGATTSNVELSACFLQSSDADTMLINATVCDLMVQDTEIVCLLANGNCIHVTLGSSLQFIGGLWRTDPAARGSGLNLDGNVTGGVQLLGVSGEAISSGDVSGEAFLVYTSGTIRRATVMGCTTATDVQTAINWPAASIPTNGLLVVGNAWDDPTPYVGFAPTDARVNCKANSFQSGLMTETAIVP